MGRHSEGWPQLKDFTYIRDTVLKVDKDEFPDMFIPSTDPNLPAMDEGMLTLFRKYDHLPWTSWNSEQDVAACPIAVVMLEDRWNNQKSQNEGMFPKARYVELETLQTYEGRLVMYHVFPDWAQEGPWLVMDIRYGRGAPSWYIV